MNVWGEWKFSSESQSRLREISLKLDTEVYSEVSADWLAFFTENSPSVLCNSEVDVNAKEDKIISLIKEALQSEPPSAVFPLSDVISLFDVIPLSEETFVGISVNSLSRILIKVKPFLDEYKFCCFCQFITTWNNDHLLDYSMRLIVLPKLKETTEASRLVRYSIEDLAIKKPDKLCREVFIPLLSDKTFNDVGLLKAGFNVFTTTYKDLLILKWSKKCEFSENDWLLLDSIIKNLSQFNLSCLLDCILKFSHKFTKSQIFGRFLVNFCKKFYFIESKEILREVIEKHDTLFKSQAMNYWFSGRNFSVCY